MSLAKENLIALCEIAKKAALSAGELIAGKQGSVIEVQSKEGGENIASSVVTEIDIKAEEIILKILTPTLKEYNLGLLTEVRKNTSGVSTLLMELWPLVETKTDIVLRLPLSQKLVNL
jgi:3'-phosphoadenosine 5'-phosphosulfate (PAPS) 3'-phosphatase